MKIVAVTSYRFDKDYLNDYKKNLVGLVDDYIIEYDEQGVFFLDEGRQRKKLIDLASSKGADWVIVMDPDERLEQDAPKRLKELVNNLKGKKALIQVNLRELYTKKHYRVDGLWNQKKRIIAFPLLPDNIYSDNKLHPRRQPLNEDFKLVVTDINLYHLKQINPKLRKQRKDLYNKLDPQHIYQDIGYDYLDDETGLELQEIPVNRMYRPKYRKYKIDKEIFTL